VHQPLRITADSTRETRSPRLTLTTGAGRSRKAIFHRRNGLPAPSAGPPARPRKWFPLEYFTEAADRLRQFFSSISVEIYPMSADDYRALIAHGVDGLTVFQETYNEDLYAEVHCGGRKRNFQWRLEAPDRGGEAGFRRIGLGALLGLGDWRVEGFLPGPPQPVPHAKISGNPKSSISFSETAGRRPGRSSRATRYPTRTLCSFSRPLRMFSARRGLYPFDTRAPQRFATHLLPRASPR